MSAEPERSEVLRTAASFLRSITALRRSVIPSLSKDQPPKGDRNLPAEKAYQKKPVILSLSKDLLRLTKPLLEQSEPILLRKTIIRHPEPLFGGETAAGNTSF
jgi:hypothetical protein